jgi:hypothetical protein
MALVGVTLGLGLAPTAAAAADPAQTSWVEALVRDIQATKAPFGMDLALSVSPFVSSLRIPVLPNTELPVGSITPYVSVGATDPSREIGEGYVLPRREVETNRTSQRMDVGAGLSWNLTDRVQLFGEMGFQRSRQQSYSLIGADPGRRDFDGTYVKGGFTIRVP